MRSMQGRYREADTTELEPQDLRAWEVPLVRDSFEGVRVLRAALLDLTERSRRIVPNPECVSVSRRHIANGSNALQRVPAEFGVDLGIADPACDPMLARAILDLAAMVDLVRDDLVGTTANGVVVGHEEWQMLISARQWLAKALERERELREEGREAE